MTRILEWLTASQHFFQDMGWLGIFAYAGVVVFVQIFLLPLSPVAIVGGVFFGFTQGFAAITLGTAAGAALNFLFARYVARGPIARRMEANEKFRLIDAAIGREGWKIVALLRFCPIPFGLANFCYGLTAIRFLPYMVASTIAIIPGNALFTWLGASAKTSVASLTGAGRPHHPLEYALLVLGLAAAFGALTYVSRIARAAVANHAPGPAAPISEIPG